MNNVKNCQIPLVLITIDTSVILKGQERNGKTIKEKKTPAKKIQAKMLRDRKNLKGRKNSRQKGFYKKEPQVRLKSTSETLNPKSREYV